MEEYKNGHSLILRNLSVSNDTQQKPNDVIPLVQDKLIVADSRSAALKTPHTSLEAFCCKFRQHEMRYLAFVAHNNMKPVMRKFIQDNKNIIKRFVLVGTSSTMSMLKEVFEDDLTVRYGPTLHSGPLGGDAELCELVCLEKVGGVIFLEDPMYSHPHQADIDSLNRQCNVHDISISNNLRSAQTMILALGLMLKNGNRDQIPSFFKTMESPSVAQFAKMKMLQSQQIYPRKKQHWFWKKNKETVMAKVGQNGI